MEKSENEVHRTHCCFEHGCKYGDEECPVVNGEIKQVYLCEECMAEGISSIDELGKTEIVKVIRCKNCIGIQPEGRKKHRCDIYKEFGNPEFYCALGRIK